MQGLPWLDDVLPALAVSGLLEAPRMTAIGAPWIASIVGTTTIADEHLDLSILVHQDHPTFLPHIRAMNVEVVSRLPHVADDGTVCYHETIGLSSSLWRPSDVVVDALDRARRTLEQGLLGHNRADFVAEAEWYWLRQGAWLTATSFLRPSRRVKTLHIASLGTTAVFLADSPDAIGVGNSMLTYDRGLFVPLEETTRHAGLDVRSLADVGSLRALIRRHASSENQRILAARLKQHPGMRWLVVGVPRDSHDQALLGIDLVRVGHPHPLCQRSSVTGKCRPFAIQRLDREYLVERGGASMSLASKKVALVGCGAVGGHIASALARSGVGELLLLDPEPLEAANLFRHVLGRAYVGLPKATALATVLASEIPYLQAHHDVRRIQDALRAQPTLLDRYDVVINAMGDVTLTRWLNRELHTRTHARVVHTWLEPLGLGGHAFLTAAEGAPGCYECLFADEHGAEILYARSDLAAPGQTFHTNHAACGGAYTPYADLDARRTAELATRIVVDTLREDSPAPGLCTWKSDARAFTAAGFHTSTRFDLAGTELDATARSLVGPRCPVCRADR